MARIKRRKEPLREVTSQLPPWTIYALPPLMALVVFANSVDGGFIYDDAWHASLFEGTAPSLASLLTTSRGLTQALHWLDFQLWGEWAPGFHLTNLVLHALATTLAASLATVMAHSRRVGLLCGLLFAVHPVHVEAVASFANRKDILAMIFVALAMRMWLGTDCPRIRYFVALGCFALGLLSKEVAVVPLVGMFFLADLVPRDGEARSVWSRLPRAMLRISPCVIGGLWIAWHLGQQTSARWTASFSSANIQALTEGQLSSYSEVLANTAAAIPEYLRLLVFPLRLSADYPLSPDLTFTNPKVLLGLFLIALWCIGTVLLTRRYPLAGLAMAWPVVMMLPLVNLVPLTTFFVAERYLYVPSFGMCLLMAWGLERYLGQRSTHSRRQAVAVFIAAVLIAGTARCVTRNGDWQSREALWASSLQQGIVTWRVHSGLGTAAAEQKRFAEAISHFEHSLALLPSRVETWQSLAGTLQQVGRTDEALTAARAILEHLPHDAYSHFLLATAAFKQGEHHTALNHYRQAVRQEPQNAGMLTSLAWLLATSSEADIHNLDNALHFAVRAHRLVDGRSSEVLFTLAEIHARRGEPSEALRWGHLAHDQAQIEGWDGMQEAIEHALRRYTFQKTTS